MLNEPSSFQSDATQIDEHDEPTEPIRCADASVPTVANNVSSVEEEDVPSPKSLTQPFPHQYVQPPVGVPNSPQQVPPLSNVYPYLPAKPGVSQDNRPAGGVVPVQPEAGHVATQEQRVRRNIVPLGVGMCFVGVQLLLLLRFVLKLLGVSSDGAWIGLLYGVSNVLVLPFRVLFLQLALPLFFTVELYTLLAILVYGIVSRIVVRILKVALKTR